MTWDHDFFFGRFWQKRLFFDSGIMWILEVSPPTSCILGVEKHAETHSGNRSYVSICISVAL